MASPTVISYAALQYNLSSVNVPGNFSRLTTERPVDPIRLAAKYFDKIFFPTVVIFGTIGNVLCYAVLMRKSFRTSTIGIYLRFLTLADLSSLYTGCLYLALLSVFEYDIRSLSELSCKFHHWLSYACCDLASWALVLVSSARFISIAWPLKKILTKRTAYITILTTVTVAGLVNLPMFLFVGDYFDERKNITKSCRPTTLEYRYFRKYIWTWVVTFKFAVVPGLFLIILNAGLITNVVKSGNAVANIEPKAPDVNKRKITWKRAKQFFSKWIGRERRVGTNAVISSDDGERLVDDPKRNLQQLDPKSQTSNNRLQLLNTSIPTVSVKVSSPSGSERDNLRMSSPSVLGGASDDSEEYSKERCFPSQKGVMFLKQRSVSCPIPSVCYSLPTFRHSLFATEGSHRAVGLGDGDSVSNFSCAPRDSTPTSKHKLGPVEFNPLLKQTGNQDLLTRLSSAVRPFKKRKLRQFSLDDTLLDNKSDGNIGITLLSMNKKDDLPVRKMASPNGSPNSEKLGFSGCKCIESDDSSNFIRQSDTFSNSSCYDGDTELGSTCHILQVNKFVNGIVEKSQNSNGYNGNGLITNHGEDITFSHDNLCFQCKQGALDLVHSRNKVQRQQSEDNSLTEKEENCALLTPTQTFSKPVARNKSTNMSKSESDSGKIGQTCILCQKIVKPCTGSTTLKKCCDSELHTLINLPESSTKTDDSIDVCQNRSPREKRKRGHDTNQTTPLLQTLPFSSEESMDYKSCHSSIPSVHFLLPFSSYNSNTEPDFQLEIRTQSSNSLDRVQDSTNSNYTLPSTNVDYHSNSLALLRPSNLSCDIALKDRKQNSDALSNSSPQVVESELALRQRKRNHTTEQNSSFNLSAKTKNSDDGDNVSIEGSYLAPPGYADNNTHSNLSVSNCRLSSATLCPATRQKVQSRNITRTLILINIMFLLCNVPIVIYLTASPYMFPGRGYSSSLGLFRSVANGSMYANNAINFLLYCITGSRFRRELRAMFRELWHFMRGRTTPTRSAHLGWSTVAANDNHLRTTRHA